MTRDGPAHPAGRIPHPRKRGPSVITLDRPTLTARALEDLTASALVVGVGTGPDGPVLLTDELPAEAATALEASFELLGVRGAEDEVHRLA